MVVKPALGQNQREFRFESSVNSYGGKTKRQDIGEHRQFESSVNSYGGKTHAVYGLSSKSFESSVNSYGGKTSKGL